MACGYVVVIRRLAYIARGFRSISVAMANYVLISTLSKQPVMSSRRVMGHVNFHLCRIFSLFSDDLSKTHVTCAVVSQSAQPATTAMARSLNYLLQLVRLPYVTYDKTTFQRTYEPYVRKYMMLELCLCVGHTSKMCKNGSNDGNAV